MFFCVRCNSPRETKDVRWISTSVVGDGVLESEISMICCTCGTRFTAVIKGIIVEESEKD